MADGSDRKIGAASLLWLNTVHPADLGLAAGASNPYPLERLNEEVERRADVVGTFHNDAAAMSVLRRSSSAMSAPSRAAA